MIKQVYACFLWVLLCMHGLMAQGDLVLQKTIRGDIRPKSISHNGQGLFFAQNMMYRHSVTVYNRDMELVETVHDAIRFADYNLTGYTGRHEGAPVEATFSEAGKYAWVSNFKMYGKGFDNPGGDQCDPDEIYDQSFVYKINTLNYEIEHVVEVGSVPKFVQATPDGQKVLVANWCSGDLSVIDTELGIETSERVFLGEYPRGIAVDSKSRYAYVGVMGEAKIAIIKLSNLSVSWIYDVGKTPRHLVIGPADRYLYVSLSRPGKVIKIDLVKGSIVAEAEVGKEARSMVMTPDGTHLYVTNYKENSVSKLRTDDMQVLETVPTQEMPVGITFDAETGQLWVACYTGSIMVFEDKAYQRPMQYASAWDGGGQKVGPHPPEEDQALAMTYVPGQPSTAESDDPYYFIYRDQDGNPAPSKVESKRATDTRKTESSPTRAVQKPVPPVASSSAESIARHYVIVGSFKLQGQAQLKLDELLGKGYGAKLLEREDGGFRVSAHDFSTRKEAQDTVNSLKRYKISAWILTQ